MEAAIAQLDMFTVSTVDPPLRDNRDAMEYPFLSLQKKRTRPIVFAAKGVHLSIAADVRSSIATIWDWDLIIFAASHLNEGIEAGLKPSPRVRFVPHDALKQMGRGTGGKDYKELAQAIRRLRLTTIITNIREDDGSGEERPFSWLSDYRIPKRYKDGAITPADPEGVPDPARPWEIELPPMRPCGPPPGPGARFYASIASMTRAKIFAPLAALRVGGCTIRSPH